ncbi:dyslexia susceptibility 1 candidate gene 1 protein homolog [Mizuhopecten yessoensis]|uniref:Dynein axonemal assembly factor 4 n=1 Tax=Mizuhopecten yessoensis TaxID=6573 RepID=A0A210QFN3_MIZYE|nr:dyslexia susceptibility 1 candidate gene 1 protein homolog [Mizuhopecten yessoensis]OWF47556.1 Dyslexia susceptibility 1 candidate gene 1 protein-like [Mizuhopecten yessoensis]
MPLAIRDYTWDETENAVFITVPLKGVKSHNVNIFSTEEYIKVSCPPYLFECLLFAEVDDRKGVAQVGNGAVVFKIFKKEPGIWGQLFSDDFTNKEVMKMKREEALVRSQARAEEEKSEKDERKRTDGKLALNEMMRLEEQERSRIEQVKQDEIKKATDDLERWKDEQKQLAEQEKQRIIEEQKAADAVLREERKKNERKNRKNKSAMIFEETAGGIPKREVGKIEVSFTARVFPTPVRESQTPQEDEWLKKQAESRKILELQDKDLTEEERNPMFLRDKGNGFFQAGNFQSAINAYTHALRLNPKMHGLYSNRAACHLKLRNYFKCIEDCSKAMDLLLPPVPQNAASRVKALVRKGTAFCELEMYVEGLQDYEAAMKIDPNNEQLKSDAERIRQVIQSSSGS